MAMNPRKIGEGLYQPLADINVTPLVDVMLVLLIIFMVTAPMLATGIKVNLPSAQDRAAARDQGPGRSSSSPRTAPCRSARIRCRATSWRRRSRRKLGDSNGVVQLRGDRDAAYGDVVSVMDELAANGVTRIAIVSSGRRARPPPAELGRREP